MTESDQEAETGADDACVVIGEADERTSDARVPEAVSGTFDDIAAPDKSLPVESPADSAAESDAGNLVRRVPMWPFLLYLLLWLVLAGVAVWQLLALPAGQAVYESRTYGWMTLGGILMTTAGPLLALVVWYAVWWDAEAKQRTGLFSAALIRGALATFGGVVVWWGAIMIIDMLRLGRSF